MVYTSETTIENTLHTPFKRHLFLVCIGVSRALDVESMANSYYGRHLAADDVEKFLCWWLAVAITCFRTPPSCSATEHFYGTPVTGHKSGQLFHIRRSDSRYFCRGWRSIQREPINAVNGFGHTLYIKRSRCQETFFSTYRVFHITWFLPIVQNCISNLIDMMLLVMRWEDSNGHMTFDLQRTFHDIYLKF